MTTQVLPVMPDPDFEAALQVLYTIDRNRMPGNAVFSCAAEKLVRALMAAELPREALQVLKLDSQSRLGDPKIAQDFVAQGNVAAVHEMTQEALQARRPDLVIAYSLAIAQATRADVDLQRVSTLIKDVPSECRDSCWLMHASSASGQLSVLTNDQAHMERAISLLRRAMMHNSSPNDFNLMHRVVSGLYQVSGRMDLLERVVAYCIRNDVPWEFREQIFELCCQAKAVELCLRVLPVTYKEKMYASPYIGRGHVHCFEMTGDRRCLAAAFSHDPSEDSSLSDYVRAEVIRALCRRQEVEEARTLTKSIEHPFFQAYALVCLMAVAPEQETGERLRVLLDGMKSLHEAVILSAKLFSLTHDHRDWQRACDGIPPEDNLLPPKFRNIGELWTVIFQAHPHTETLHRMAEFLGREPNVHHWGFHDGYMSEWAEWAADKGLLDMARICAQSNLVNECGQGFRARAWSAIALVSGHKQDFDRARACAALEPHPDARVEAYSCIALACRGIAPSVYMPLQEEPIKSLLSPCP